MIDKAQRANRRGELDAEIDSRYIQIANEFALLVAARINQLGTPHKYIVALFDELGISASLGQRPLVFRFFTHFQHEKNVVV